VIIILNLIPVWEELINHDNLNDALKAQETRGKENPEEDTLIFTADYRL
jgi:hypothetical protein